MKLERLMKEQGMDAILITNMLNIRYFTGFTGTTGTALAIGDKRYFITDFRYVSQGKNEVEKNGFELVCENISTLKKVGELLKENKVKKLGIENQSVTLDQFDLFKNNFENIEYLNLNDLFTKEREIKNEFEIKTIEESIKIAEKALEITIPKIKIGVKERDIAAELEYQMRKLGASKPSFDIIVASNERSALPHGVASEKLIEEGFLTIDYGCFYNGYASDITRTFYMGETPEDKHLEIYEIVKTANEMAIKAVKPGVSTSELDAIARNYITEKGYGEYFGHGLGHGIGLQIHEYPGVSFKAENKILKEGMVITIEPGIYISNFGGVRIEDDVLVTKDSYKVLTNLNKKFIKL
ncbi:aminopeptidase P family protein [Cetobacterium sp. 8H]|uniref:aminopeptidase P family protein n=1 Tax=Cetobacterium sp. 8H TaxID=2759681 RepID=UPI00163BB0E2|nr:aminopeptidase P family protein [Cetobacterium sp. 8H]MBC2851206.1 aminopeptidase P family protein [Cetobacterium sp. 8H]